MHSGTQHDNPTIEGINWLQSDAVFGYYNGNDNAAVVYDFCTYSRS